MPQKLTKDNAIQIISELAPLGYSITTENSSLLLKAVSDLFSLIADREGYSEREIRAMKQKFKDAGRRSAPWKPTSSLIPGRPQNGSDGNRINRWLLPEDHKFYADQKTATLVEVKYFLQLLSMKNAPNLPSKIVYLFDWLTHHPIIPNMYKDPIQLIEIDFDVVMHNSSLLQSGHLYPLDRGGTHHPENTFLMLSASNQLQGNLTLDELINLMSDIVSKHSSNK